MPANGRWDLTWDKYVVSELPALAAVRRKVWVCGHSPAEIVGSNPTGGM